MTDPQRYPYSNAQGDELVMVVSEDLLDSCKYGVCVAGALSDTEEALLGELFRWSSAVAAAHVTPEAWPQPDYSTRHADQLPRVLAQRLINALVPALEDILAARMVIDGVEDPVPATEPHYVVGTIPEGSGEAATIRALAMRLLDLIERPEP